MKSGIQAVGVAMLEGKARRRAKTRFVVQHVGVERPVHQAIHGLADEIEGVRFEDAL